MEKDNLLLHTITQLIFFTIVKRYIQKVHTTRAFSKTAVVTYRYDTAIPVLLNRVEFLFDDAHKAAMNIVQ